MNENKIIHIDVDAFYASVEEIDNPNLIGKPVVVGGRSKRGIITTANYEARKYGIHSAMPLFIAKNLYPSLIIVPGRRHRYLEKSKEVFDILHKYTDTLEKVSIDEAYLDLSNSLNSVDIAKQIKNDVKDKTGLTVSCGVSYNKFLAKLASDWNKPDGLKIISKNDIPDILLPLDIKKVHGLGRKSQEKLRNIGINTVEDMFQLDLEFLEKIFGKMGYEIYQRIRGIDNRAVNSQRSRKSLGVERTFPDTRDKYILLNRLIQYSVELSKDLSSKNLGFQTLTLKLKTFDFKINTHSKTYSHVINDKQEIENLALELFNTHYKGEKLRLMGISASNLQPLSALQFNFLHNW